MRGGGLGGCEEGGVRGGAGEVNSCTFSCFVDR